MLALDSNVLLRHFLQDDPVQSPLAGRLLAEELTGDNPGFVSVAVLCETVWTLRAGYRADSGAIADAVARLLTATQIVVASEAAVLAALRSAGDFVDALVHELGRAAGCTETVTFDRRFAKLGGVRLLGG